MASTARHGLQEYVLNKYDAKARPEVEKFEVNWEEFRFGGSVQLPQGADAEPERGVRFRFGPIFEPNFASTMEAVDGFCQQVACGGAAGILVTPLHTTQVRRQYWAGSAPGAGSGIKMDPCRREFRGRAEHHGERIALPLYTPQHTHDLVGTVWRVLRAGHGVRPKLAHPAAAHFWSALRGAGTPGHVVHTPPEASSTPSLGR
ncbi:hypothetical protein B0H16DRAFT_1479940 [Mycena metata]|uniref:Uncharacterized protein n=1 Tax=Mycena metata TaxID=1033252 RepID=A0AAD7H4P1_9AGAR|nr:hypothetical protein B0H16DRAFT_1479940 [Mycena metata]